MVSFLRRGECFNMSPPVLKSTFAQPNIMRTDRDHNLEPAAKASRITDLFVAFDGHFSQPACVEVVLSGSSRKK